MSTHDSSQAEKANDASRDEPSGPFSEAFISFYIDSARQTALVHYLLGMMEEQKRPHLEIAKAITEPTTREEAVIALVAAKKVASTIEAHFRYTEILDEMLLCRFVDSFLTYVSETLANVFTARPEMLKSREQVTWEEVLNQADTAALVRFAAERKVMRLAYMSFRDLCAELQTKHGIELIPDPKQCDRIAYAVEIRNLIVHNRGVVNSRFVSRASHSSFEIGEQIKLTIEWVVTLAELLVRCASDIDRRVCEKFSLSRPVRSLDDAQERLDRLQKELRETPSLTERRRNLESRLG